MLFGETVAVYCENHTEHTNFSAFWKVANVRNCVKKICIVEKILILVLIQELSKCLYQTAHAYLLELSYYIAKAMVYVE
jgi:hypothetical protein